MAQIKVNSRNREAVNMPEQSVCVKSYTERYQRAFVTSESTLLYSMGAICQQYRCGVYALNFNHSLCLETRGLCPLLSGSPFDVLMSREQPTQLAGWDVPQRQGVETIQHE